jgi:hypothetical protein
MEKKWNYYKTASIITNKIKPVLNDVSCQNALFCLQLMSCANHASDRFA